MGHGSGECHGIFRTARLLSVKTLLSADYKLRHIRGQARDDGGRRSLTADRHRPCFQSIRVDAHVNEVLPINIS